MRFIFVLATIIAAALSLPANLDDLPEPSELAFVLNEDDFEDYLDSWLEIQQRNNGNATQFDARSGN